MHDGNLHPKSAMNKSSRSFHRSRCLLSLCFSLGKTTLCSQGLGKGQDGVGKAKLRGPFASADDAQDLMCTQLVRPKARFLIAENYGKKTHSCPRPVPDSFPFTN